MPDADSAYSTDSVGNDKTYLDGMATGEADYMKVVANKWHEFRTGTISAAERDSAISAKWTEFQAATVTKRNTFRVDQATDAATFRNTVVGAAKTHVDAVTTAGETLTDSLQNAQKTLATTKWNAWLTASKNLVNLDAESSIAKAESLADAIGELATENPISGSTGTGETQTAWSAANPFWVGLAAKADQSAEYIADTKNAERLYYGRSPWSVPGTNGAIHEHPFGTRGVLDARRDYEVGMAVATATQHKALQHAAGTRDRELAAAAVQLAQSRGAYETNWANLNLESSGWHLDQPTLPITGTIDGTITVTPNAGTTFVPGWFSSVGHASSLSSSSSSSAPTTTTGFSSGDLDHYFGTGLMPDMPDTDPVTTGKASRDDSRFTSVLTQPAAHDGNQTQPPTTSGTATTADGNPGYEPPQTSTSGEPNHIYGLGELTVVDGKLVEIPPKPAEPGFPDGSLPALPLLPPELIIDPILLGQEANSRISVDPFNGGQGPLLSAVDADSAATSAMIFVFVPNSWEANSVTLANSELSLTELEAVAIEVEAEAVADELRAAAGEVTLEELFKVTLPPGEAATFDWKAIQTAYVERYGEEGIAALMLLYERGWGIKEANYWGDWSWSHDHWPDHGTNTIYINRGDWFNLAGRSPWNAAGQLHDSVVQAITDREKEVRSFKRWELMEREYPFLTTWVLRLADDSMLNLNSSTLEWLEGESMDGRTLTPDEISARGWEAATSFGVLVLTGVGMKLPGGAAASAESMAGRSLAFRILHAPIGGSMAAGARSTAGAVARSALGQAVLRNPRIVALQLRLAALQQRLAALRANQSALSIPSRAARQLLEGPFSRLGTSPAIRASRGIPLTLSLRLQRFFATAVGYPQVASTPIGRLLTRMRGVNWEQGHVFIQQRWFRAGGPTQWYPGNALANLGLRRIGNAGWNLLPMPKSLNGFLGRHAWASFGVGAGVATGTTVAIGGTGYYGLILTGESLGLGKDVVVIILQD